jgi:hypothetical protein
MAEDISSSMSSLNVLAVDGEILSKDELGLYGLSATATGDDEDVRSRLAEIGLEVENDHDTLLAEVVAAEQARREAKGTAPKELLHGHHEKQMEDIREKLAELTAKLHRHKGSRRRPPDLGPPRTGQA